MHVRLQNRIGREDCWFFLSTSLENFMDHDCLSLSRNKMIICFLEREQNHFWCKIRFGNTKKIRSTIAIQNNKTSTCILIELTVRSSSAHDRLLFLRPFWTQPYLCSQLFLWMWNKNVLFNWWIVLLEVVIRSDSRMGAI